MKFELIEITASMSSAERIAAINENEQRRAAILGKAMENFNQTQGVITIVLQ